MRWEKKLATPIKTNPGPEKNNIVRYVFLSTIVLALAFSALASWAFLGDNAGQDLCAYMEKGYQPRWHDIYSTVNDQVCIWKPMFYIMVIYLFFYALLPLQIATLGTWLVKRLLTSKP
ncbi:MAG: hypothetical protein KDJ35_07770 [Alphaproteobacteria bacterium]|nr:hypothetical protein [Alphaproteobacteria bacterium]